MQMTIGLLLDALGREDPKAKVAIAGHERSRFCSPHSYRGYYHDLAFEVEDGSMTVNELMILLNSIIGQEFEGYKGGMYRMDFDTRIWVSAYGVNSGDYVSGIVTMPTGNVLITWNREER